MYDRDFDKWITRLKWAGFLWERIPCPNGHKVRVYRPPPGGLASYGEGDSLAAALQSAAHGQTIDWYAVERKMTDEAWMKLSHL